MNTALAVQLGWSLLAGVLAAGGSWTVTNPGKVWAALGGVISKLKRTVPMPAPTTVTNDDHADLEAMLRLQKRADKSGCPKFQEAVRACEVCFFNHAEPKS